MRYYKILAAPFNDGRMVAAVAPLDAELQDILVKEIDWDTCSLDGKHDIWVEEGSIFNSDVHFARIGQQRNVPLPAIVLGVQGEKCTDATIALEDLLGLVSLETG